MTLLVTDVIIRIRTKAVFSHSIVNGVMINICSLDFLNRKVFDVDVLSADGRILFHLGSEITPEILLMLYYKDIYVTEFPYEKEKKKTEEDINEKLETLNLIQSLEAVIDENLTEFLEFDEQQAQRVSQYSVKLGQKIGMETLQLQELEKAAYYHNIGRTKLTNSDLKEKDFKKKQAEAGYSLLITEKNLSEKIAEAARFYNRNCWSSQINFNDVNHSDLPYSHIVAITSYYDELINKNNPKDEVLKKMLQLGGNKFNIFILHKFIYMMRNSND